MSGDGRRPCADAEVEPGPRIDLNCDLGEAETPAGIARDRELLGVVTSANGISYVAAPGLGMALYAIDPHWPFAASAALLIGLVLWGRRQLATPVA